MVQFSGSRPNKKSGFSNQKIMNSPILSSQIAVYYSSKKAETIFNIQGEVPAL
jgi:hypothetical protein